MRVQNVSMNNYYQKNQQKTNFGARLVNLNDIKDIIPSALCEKLSFRKLLAGLLGEEKASQIFKTYKLDPEKVDVFLTKNEKAPAKNYLKKVLLDYACTISEHDYYIDLIMFTGKRNPLNKDDLDLKIINDNYEKACKYLSKKMFSPNNFSYKEWDGLKEVAIA